MIPVPGTWYRVLIVFMRDVRIYVKVVYNRQRKWMPLGYTQYACILLLYHLVYG